MKKIKYLFLILSLITLASCNARFSGSVVDQGLRSLDANQSESTINNMTITEKDSGLELKINYIDSDNNYREERAFISMIKNAYAYNATMNFESLNKHYSGQLNCKNTTCSNLDIELKMNSSSNKTIRIAQREFILDSSLMKFTSKEYQREGDVLFEAELAKTNSNSSNLTMRLTTIDGVELPLVDIESTETSGVTYKLKSKGVNSKISLGVTSKSGKDYNGDFDVKQYSANGYGKFYLALSNYSGEVVIDTN